jgi:hypothetical protein
MEIRFIPLEDQHQHFLDGAAECGEIFAHTHTAVGLYGDPAQISDAISMVRASRGGRRSACIRLVEIGDEILRGVDAGKREAMLIMGVRSALRNARDIAETCSNWAHEDETVGGSLQPYRRYERVRRDGTATKGAQRMLCSPGFIARYIRHDDSVRFLSRLSTLLLAHPLNPSDRAMDHVFDLHLDLDRQLKAFRAFWQGDETPTNQRLRADLFGRQKPVPYTIIRKQRKVAKRAAVMAAAILGASTVGAFARGEPVVLPGQDLALRVRLAGPLHRVGHGMMAVDLLDRRGVDLASLCVYVDKTPALDQLTAFALHMQGGLERDIVRTANLITTTAAGNDHPIIRERAEQRAVTGAAAPGLFGNDWQGRRLAQQAYWRETGHIWTREVCKQMFGRRTAFLSSILADEAMAPGYDLPIPGEHP